MLISFLQVLLVDILRILFLRHACAMKETNEGVCVCVGGGGGWERGWGGRVEDMAR